MMAKGLRQILIFISRSGFTNSEAQFRRINLSLAKACRESQRSFSRRVKIAPGYWLRLPTAMAEISPIIYATHLVNGSNSRALRTASRAQNLAATMRFTCSPATRRHMESCCVCPWTSRDYRKRRSSFRKGKVSFRNSHPVMTVCMCRICSAVHRSFSISRKGVYTANKFQSCRSPVSPVCNRGMVTISCSATPVI